MIAFTASQKRLICVEFQTLHQTIDYFHKPIVCLTVHHESFDLAQRILTKVQPLPTTQNLTVSQCLLWVYQCLVSNAHKTSSYSLECPGKHEQVNTSTTYDYLFHIATVPSTSSRNFHKQNMKALFKPFVLDRNAWCNQCWVTCSFACITTLIVRWRSYPSLNDILV